MLLLILGLSLAKTASAASIEFNSTGGTTATNGLHFYIEDTTHIQVTRLNGTGQVFQSSPLAVPPSTRLDNGIFLRANGKIYGPGHTVGSGFTPDFMFSTYAIGAANPPNPSASGVQQTATGTFGVTAGPQVTLIWKYTTPLDFITAEVTLVIPSGYAVSTANPVRYYHIFDTFLGGSDNGCGVKFTDTNGNFVMGTYPPTGSSCPSSTSIPAGVTIVESFRERGLAPAFTTPHFSNYCAAGYADFWGSTSKNCYVKQTSAMSNFIDTTYEDTGIGIEYDFTATGTYTFSYDFVIGSTTVPPYDHLEIRHDGSTTLCPDNVTVLACTSATVPCPALSIVNTGTLTGSLTTTPTTPAVTKTPATFTLGSSASTAVVALQGSGAGTYTLGTSGLSSVPLNGTKCWNTATSTASCTFTVVNTPCVSNFECLETGASYNNLVSTPAARNPLYTKLTGTNFKFDVAALQASGAIASSYTATQNVTVELFDDSASPQPACSAYTSPVASQAITFAAGDSGRKTVVNNINLANAYRKLRCRVTDTNITPTVYGCSSDGFTVRPQSIGSVTSSANADSAGTNANATPVVKAGAAFTLTANTGTPGYNNAPKVDASNLEWLNVPSGGRAAPGTGALAGSFTTAATSATGNGATGSAFTYDEAGYFRFKVQGVYDDTFTSYSSDLANGDCTNDASNTLVGGKYGCKFGNTAVTNYFGRFIPDHFDFGAASLTNRSDLACAPASPFTYMGEPIKATFTLTAQNTGNTTTQNYMGSFAKLNLTVPGSFFLGAQDNYPASGVRNITQITKANPGVVTTSAPHGYAPGDMVYISSVGGMAQINNLLRSVLVIDSTHFSFGDTSTWSLYSSGGIARKKVSPGTDLTTTRVTTISSSGSWAAGVAANIPLTFSFNRAAGTTVDGPYVPEFGIAPVDPDSVLLGGYNMDINTPPTTSDHRSIGLAEVRYGRLQLSNAYGSELVELRVPFTAQYYNGSTFVLNTEDSCTQVTVPTAGSGLSKNPGTLNTTAKVNNVSAGQGTFIAGDGGLVLSPPNAKGVVDVTIIAPLWLQYFWTGAALSNPASRATFGVYKGGPVIYLRELF